MPLHILRTPNHHLGESQGMMWHPSKPGPDHRHGVSVSWMSEPPSPSPPPPPTPRRTVTATATPSLLCTSAPMSCSRGNTTDGGPAAAASAAAAAEPDTARPSAPSKPVARKSPNDTMRSPTASPAAAAGEPGVMASTTAKGLCPTAGEAADRAAADPLPLPLTAAAAEEEASAAAACCPREGPRACTAYRASSTSLSFTARSLRRQMTRLRAARTTKRSTSARGNPSAGGGKGEESRG
jgi:hypothetical protein